MSKKNVVLISEDKLGEAWTYVTKIMQKELTEANFKTWLLPVTLDQIEVWEVGEDSMSRIVIATPSGFVSKNLEKLYSKRLSSLLSKSLDLTIESLIFKVGGIKKNTPDTKANNRSTGDDKNNQSKSSPRRDSKTVHTQTKGYDSQKTRGFKNSKIAPKTTGSGFLPINPEYTFNSFVVGGSNELAYTIAQAIVNEPGERFNPLFVYGGVGLGKTHLMQAVANAIKAEDPSKKIIYTSTQTYINDFLDHIRNKSSGNFSKTYNDADILIVDDIQFIAGKDKTMEEFFHTFNMLHQNKKQIILSADQPPRSIPTLPDRLRSRFEWGMTVDIQSPDFETRCAIIQSKASSQGVELEYEVVEFIATTVKSNIRELEGSLNQILIMSEIQNIKPSLTFVKNILKASSGTPTRFDAKKIVKACSEHFGFKESDLLSPRRDQELVYARQVAMYLMRTELKMSLPKIATAVGRKDHTTAMHSINKISGMLDSDFNLKRDLAAIKQALYA